MKKIFKILGIIIITIISLFSIFIFEECVRLKINESSKPLVIIDRTKYCVTCIEPGEELEIEYLSLGYKVKIKYYLLERSSDDNKMIKVVSKEFLLFNHLRLWAWIS